ncbi:MAG: NUDIX domain-containing protein [Chlorobiaceae bacterium]|nr:NUDIX domain-containing protein [Chlorobiaceae bacterium]NTW73565.1 NUDIX domain-containing protein [Chlorobiaceae bacterium]
MKRSGASIILVNSRNQVLLLLRDDKPEIPYPNMWDLPGGHVEPGETPMECIVREMMEEIETDVSKCSLLKVYDFPDRIEYIFLMELDVEADAIPLHEGQCLRWFAARDLQGLELAFGFDLVLNEFFANRTPPGIP